MSIISGIKGILYKEFKSEFRSAFNTSSILIFSIISVIIIYLALGELLNEPKVFSGVYWLIIFFNSMITLPRSFISDEETGVALLIKLNSDSLGVLFGKLIYNLINNLLISVIAGLSLWLASGLFINQIFEFIIVIFLICLSFAIACTLLSAIIAKSSKRASLLPILGFPILIPIIYLGIDASQLAISGLLENYYDILFLLIYSAILISISVILFDFIWED